MDAKPECPACGRNDYDGELIGCSWCGGLKCSHCDMGDSTGCVVCDSEEAE